MKIVDQKTLPIQIFNGLEYRLYPRERYFSRGCKRLHVIVWEFYNNSKVPKGYHVHHENENTFDNSKDNLVLKEAYIHQREHIIKRHKENPEWSKLFHSKGIEAAKEWHKSDEGRQWHTNAWANSLGKTMIEKDMICQQCGKAYTTKKVTGSKFCHQNCKAKALRARRKAIHSIH